MQKDMISRLNAAINRWKHSKNTKDLSKVYANDRKDLRHIRSLFRQGKIKECRKAIYNLDTIVRDQIPCDIFRKLILDISMSL